MDKKFGIEQRSAETVEMNRRFIFSFQGKRKTMRFDNHSLVQTKGVRRLIQTIVGRRLKVIHFDDFKMMDLMADDGET